MTRNRKVYQLLQPKKTKSKPVINNNSCNSNLWKCHTEALKARLCNICTFNWEEHEVNIFVLALCREPGRWTSPRTTVQTLRLTRKLLHLLPSRSVYDSWLCCWVFPASVSQRHSGGLCRWHVWGARRGFGTPPSASPQVLISTYELPHVPSPGHRLRGQNQSWPIIFTVWPGPRSHSQRHMAERLWSSAPTLPPFFFSLTPGG